MRCFVVVVQSKSDSCTFLIVRKLPLSRLFSWYILCTLGYHILTVQTFIFTLVSIYSYSNLRAQGVFQNIGFPSQFTAASFKSQSLFEISGLQPGAWPVKDNVYLERSQQNCRRHFVSMMFLLLTLLSLIQSKAQFLFNLSLSCEYN